MKFLSKYAWIIFILLPIAAWSADWVNVVPIRSQTETRILHWNGKFMLLSGTLGYAFTSEDGRTWTSARGSESGGSAGLVTRYVPVNGLLYAMSYSDLQRSTDAIHWTRVTEPPKCDLADLAGGNGILVGVSDCSDREIWTSPDGDRWTSHDYPFEAGVDRIAFGNGVFVAMNEKQIASSTDATEWTIRHSEPQATNVDGLEDLVFAKGRFVAVAWKGQVLTSTDGKTWEVSAIAGDRTQFQSLVFQGDRFIAQAQTSNELHVSLDGLQWRLLWVNLLKVTSIAYGNGQFLATDGKGNLSVSDDSAKVWAEKKAPKGDINAVLHTDKGFLAIGSGGMLATSSDAVQWIERPADTLWSATGAAWGAGTTVAVGPSGLIRTSTDLINWVTRSSGTKEDLATITYGNSVFVATTGNGRILTSSDGVEWVETYVPPKSITLENAAFGNGIFLITVGSEIKSLLTSPDGKRWTLHQHGGLEGSFGTFLAFGNSRFLMGYRRSLPKRDSVWITEDGITMRPQQIEFKFDRFHYFARSMTFGNGYFHGLDADGLAVLSSANGEGAWTADSSNTFFATHLTYTGGKLFKFGASTLSSATGYTPSAIARNPIRFAPMARAQRIPSGGLWLPAAWMGQGRVAEILDVKGNRIFQRKVSGKGNSTQILPPAEEGAYFIRFKNHD